MENQGIVELDQAIEVLCERLRTLEDESCKINEFKERASAPKV